MKMLKFLNTIDRKTSGVGIGSKKHQSLEYLFVCHSTCVIIFAFVCLKSRGTLRFHDSKDEHVIFLFTLSFFLFVPS